MAKKFKNVEIGSYPFFNFDEKRGGINIVVSSWTMENLDDVVCEIQDMITLNSGKSSIV